MALATLLTIGLAFSVAAANSEGLTYSAPYGTVTVDGSVDAAWDAAPWETAKPAETPVDTDKAPATADASLAVAAVFMAATAMVVLSKKR